MWINNANYFFINKEILVIEHADFDGMERLSAATGAEIMSTFDDPSRSDEVLGYCDSIEEIIIGEDKVIKFSGCKSGFPKFH